MNEILKLEKLNVNEEQRFYVSEETKIIKDDEYSLPKDMISIVIPKSVVNIGKYFLRGLDVCEIINYSNIDIKTDSPILIRKSIDDNNSLLICNNRFIFIEKDNKLLLIKYIGNDCELELPTKLEFEGKIINEYEISNEAFRCNLNLKKISIPGSVKRIGDRAFYECDNLEYVKIDKGVEYVGWNSFYFDDSFVKFDIFDSIKCIAEVSFYSLSLNEFDDCLYLGNNENPYLILVEYKENNKEFSIHPKCKIIQGKAFMRFDFKNITFPNSVKYIANFAFDECRFENVVFESDDVVIANDAFYLCKFL